MKKWKELKRELVYSGYRRVERVGFEMPDGTSRDFEIKQEDDAVAVLALDIDGNVILAQQFRPGPQKIFYELPGGCIDEGEDAETAALRELKEETGYVGDVEFVGTVYDDAYSSVKRYCFVAKSCQKKAGQELDDDEYIEIHKKSLGEFRALLQSGKMTDVEAGYLCLDHLGLLVPAR